MKFYVRICLLSMLAGCSVSLSAGCDSKNVFDTSYELSPKAYQNIEDIYLSIDAENDEKLIRTSFVAEANAALFGISDCSKFRAAINGFDQYQAARILSHSLPTDNNELRAGNTKKLLKAFTGLVSTKYFLDTKVVFDSKMLAMLEEGFNYHRKGNVFRQARFVKTAKKIIYWHWKNDRASDKVFYSTNKDYFPFSEKTFINSK